MIPKRRLIILGSTGSIGTQAIEVVEHLRKLYQLGFFPVEYEIVGLAASRSADLLASQAAAHNVKHVALAHSDHPLTNESQGKSGLHVFRGPQAAAQLVQNVECDIVLSAMVGVAGLPATLLAAQLGRDIALANKETLVAAGSIVVPACEKSGSKLLPVDSEHCGVWECLAGKSAPLRSHEAKPHSPVPPFKCDGHVERITITASGGAFREWTREQLARATPEQAMKHPTWTMGRKVTIDSASLMNKGLELIEAHWLFGLPAEKLSALIHPQSIVHAMVEFTDRTIMAQLAKPDMRTPIHAALAHPHAAPSCSNSLPWSAMRTLTFEDIDPQRFPAIELAYEAIRRGGQSGTTLNAANEEAVNAFINGSIGFLQIPELVKGAMDASEKGLNSRSLGAVHATHPSHLNLPEEFIDIQHADQAARAWVLEHVG